MIQLKTLLNVLDNSGGAIAECIATLKSSKAGATIGDRIIVVVQEQRNYKADKQGSSNAPHKVKRGDIRHAVVVRTKKKLQRPDGSVVRFDDNACILINKAAEPIGSRATGVVGRELAKTRWSKILSLAPMHV
ncbi:50S ribosomal protein L14 [Pseudovirgaria hyperparasitica]|uniref:Large ribosomal subunit protein uL14m n=1 Tax=Pseudovirgaria hyperparasitica TaxID=470096 RepID=A0A6A6WM87_9PEZI|nr:50S ribosomal protein L14 [Pseudovirgaria hyperparasitica]KAF2763272.1 50S ribosomal protein L14 [Pseudovirgaria hyperparasitica]